MCLSVHANRMSLLQTMKMLDLFVKVHNYKNQRRDLWLNKRSNLYDKYLNLFHCTCNAKILYHIASSNNKRSLICYFLPSLGYSDYLI